MTQSKMIAERQETNNIGRAIDIGAIGTSAPIR
jgi:hypothetical protein